MSEHIHAFLLGLSLSLSAASFLVWAWLSGLLRNPEEAKERAFEIETGLDARAVANVTENTKRDGRDEH